MNPTRTEIPFEDRSPRAFACYRELVEEANRDPVVVAHDYELTDAASTWNELTTCEMEVFGIDPRLLNALVHAHLRYENMVGVTDTEFMPFRGEERAAYPEWFRGDGVYATDDAIAFMVLACRLPAPQAIAWVCRVKVQHLRSGLVDDAVQPPEWAFAEVK